MPRGKVFRHDIGHGILWLRSDGNEDAICNVRDLPPAWQPPEPGPFTGERKSLVGMQVLFSLVSTPHFLRAEKIYVCMGAYEPHRGALRS